MGLLKNVQKECCGSRIAITCILVTVAMLLAVMGKASAASQPRTIAELALYQGPERGKILIEGAKKEGQINIYFTQISFKKVIQGFEKKYPFIKAIAGRFDSMSMLKKVTVEHTAGRFLLDVALTTSPTTEIFQRKGILQEFYSPEMRFYEDEYKLKGKKGVFYVAHYENLHGLGFNTRLIPPPEAPKSLNDLLDPRWKGKISIVGSTSGTKFIGNALDVMGPDFIEKLRSQDVKVQNISAGAMGSMIASGEVPLSPTIPYSSTFALKEKGADVAWRPLEPCVNSTSYVGISSKSPNPNAALLFLDYVLSKEGQKLSMALGLMTPREDMGSTETKIKKTIFESKYSLEEYERKFPQWQKLLTTFIERK